LSEYRTLLLQRKPTLGHTKLSTVLHVTRRLDIAALDHDFSTRNPSKSSKASKDSRL